MKQYDLTIGQVAKKFSVSYSVVWRMANTGRLPHVRVGRSYRFNEDEIVAALTQ